RVFYYEDDKRGWIKQEILQRIENCWRNSRNHLFHKIYDEELTFEENIKRKPVGIEANHWKKFLQYRMDDDTKSSDYWTSLYYLENKLHDLRDEFKPASVLLHSVLAGIGGIPYEAVKKSNTTI
ncbi:hypothetical protein HN51_046315, partial [Arachis hypogaea]